jgi:hypothetical protein
VEVCKWGEEIVRSGSRGRPVRQWILDILLRLSAAKNIQDLKRLLEDMNLMSNNDVERLNQGYIKRARLPDSTSQRPTYIFFGLTAADGRPILKSYPVSDK